MSEETKSFGVRTVLTVTTGRVLTVPEGDNDNGIGDLYKILGHMTNDSPYTHQLGRFADECKPWLLRWFPELAKVDDYLGRLDELIARHSANKQTAIEVWIAMTANDCSLKSTYDVPRIPADDHEQKDPYDELVIMGGTDEGIEIVQV